MLLKKKPNQTNRRPISIPYNIMSYESVALEYFHQPLKNIGNQKICWFSLLEYVKNWY